MLYKLEDKKKIFEEVKSQWSAKVKSQGVWTDNIPIMPQPTDLLSFNPFCQIQYFNKF